MEKIINGVDNNQIVSESNDAIAKKWKDRGNDFYKQKNLESALEAYKNGVKYLERSDQNKNCVEMEFALRSNIGLVLYNLERYEMAVVECNKALSLKPGSLKVLFRRGLAQEKCSPPNLDGAASDLKLYIEKRKPSKDAMNALKRIEKKMKLRAMSSNEFFTNSEQEAKANGNISLCAMKESFEREIIENDANSQKNIVLRLLDQSRTPKRGEAYFLISYPWWEQWCNYTKIMETLLARNEQWYRIFERSKALHRQFKIPDPSIDTDSDSLSSSESSCDSHPLHKLQPGIIDNSMILNPFIRDSSEFLPVRPYLLRGCQFEILPREVYAALRSWYGEKTPSIHRRVVTINEKAKIFLHYNKKNPPTSDNICFTCHSTSSFKCSRCSLVFYCSKDCQTSHWPYHKQYCSRRIRYKKQKKYDGAMVKWNRCGLNNLGNTCFLNSALQSLSHAKILSLYFLTNQYIKDINANNPLGAGGYLAKSYDKVLKDLFLGSFNSVSPTTLKRAIAVYAPRFAGCHQHDAQEFLAYLLDGLHEDLNRIREKQYVELPDVDGGRKDMKVAGAEAWEAFKSRNDSLIMDTFYGQFKSTCVCPRCEKVSVSFDSFNHISLEIPQDYGTTRCLPVILFRLNPSSQNGTNHLPQRYGVVVDKQGCVGDLKDQLKKICGISKKHLIICDIYENNVYEIINDSKQISKIRSNDILTAYESDSYNENRIHFIGTHLAPRQISKNFGNLTQLHEGVDLMTNIRLDKFGYPLVSNFDSTLSCENIWEFLWNQVSCFVMSDDVTSIEYIKEKFRIRIVDQHGNPRRLFSDSPNHGSLLPRNSSSPILQFLGEDSFENYLFVSFEWLHVNPNERSISEKKGFEFFRNHPSFSNQNFRSNVITLDQCFSKFTQAERLDEQNKWYCSTCKTHVRAMKTMQLWNLPDVLVIHLKRFDYKYSRTKLDTFIDFPLENLDLNSLIVGESTSIDEADSFVQEHADASYNLFAVINHFGKMGFGHYTAYAKEWEESNNMDTTWRVFDDSNVGYLKKDLVVSRAAYVLFYKRVS